MYTYYLWVNALKDIEQKTSTSMIINWIWGKHKYCTLNYLQKQRLKLNW